MKRYAITFGPDDSRFSAWMNYAAREGLSYRKIGNAHYWYTDDEGHAKRARALGMHVATVEAVPFA